MKSLSDSELKAQLKRLIVEECDKPVDPDSIADDELLFGNTARLQLDSLDALQLSMGLQRRYGIRMTDSKELRRVFATIAMLVEFLRQRA